MEELSPVKIKHSALGMCKLPSIWRKNHEYVWMLYPMPKNNSRRAQCVLGSQNERSYVVQASNWAISTADAASTHTVRRRNIAHYTFSRILKSCTRKYPLRWYFLSVIKLGRRPVNILPSLKDNRKVWLLTFDSVTFLAGLLSGGDKRRDRSS